MCGIIGYTGYSDARGVLIKGLKVLEYRGYDSAGVALSTDSSINVIKCKGRVEKLDEITKNLPVSNTGIGHTRWATHGEVSDTNSHPHNFGKVTVVHNGIIENYSDLTNKYEFENKLKSQTDSEVAAAVINHFYSGNPEEAIKNAVKEFKGTFALGIIFDDIKNTIFCVRNVSPIVVCRNEDGAYIASDVLAIGEYSKDYFVLPEMTIAKLEKDKITLTDFSNNEVVAKMSKLDWDITNAGKCGYPFYMEKEIMEQPEVLEKTITPRISNMLPDFSKDNVDDSLFEGIDNISVIACGTAMHAGLIGKGLFQSKVNIPCEVHLASEFMYTDPVINEKTLLICVSQSGETIDTLEALKYGKKNGAKSLSIVNVKGSSIARESDYVIYTDAGPEIAVASTKAYTTQVSIFFLIVAKMAQVNETMSDEEIKNYISGVLEIPKAAEIILEQKDAIHHLSKAMLTTEHAFMIGRGQDYPALLEAALKLKEISYIHTEAFASGELKHGTIALITQGTPVVALVTQSALKSKQISNIREVQSRGAEVITLIKKSLNDGSISCSFELPDLMDEFMVIPSVIAMQLLAYYVSSDKGLDVDKPRNLAKVVTVE